MTLRCTVRGCGLPLQRSPRGAHCERNHQFDAARSGYLNLLQPQDRRSSTPGDHRQAVEARRRLFDSGCIEPLYAPLHRYVDAGARVLDSGCGEGSFLASQREKAGALTGVDLAVHAVDLAARSYEGVTWVVANLDRGVPLVDSSVDVIFSIAARRNPQEFRRVLAPAGRVVVAVPGADDLVELREAIGGTRATSSRSHMLQSEFGGGWSVASSDTLMIRGELDRSTIDDLLSASYRGQRRSGRTWLNEVDRLSVTRSFDVFVFEPLE